jgi:Ca2+-binding RTX toxin-like protein
MATIFVSPLGGGTGTGASASDAMPFSKLNAAVQAAGPGGTVMLLADKGAYETTGSTVISSGGLPGLPVTVKGVDSFGNAMDVTINGTRDTTWTAGETATGNYVFKLYAGASNIKFEGMDFHNVGMAFQLAGDLSNVTIQNMEGYNVRYFVGNYVGGSSTTATVSGLTIKDVAVHGFSKSVIVLKYDTNNVVIDNVFGDSQYQDGDSFAMGVLLDGTVHDVLIKNSTMMNARASNYTYWNGDGFAAERGVYNLRIENSKAIGNADGGFDLKSSNTVLVDTYAEDNGRNYRLWATAELINPIGVDPRIQGGSSSQVQIWVSSNASVKVTGGYFVDSGSATFVATSDGGALSFIGTNFWHASSAALKIGTGIAGIDTALVNVVAATGTYSVDGEKYLVKVTEPTSPPPPPPSEPIFTPVSKSFTGTSGDDVIAPGTNDHWTVNAGSGNDVVTTLNGNDIVTGAAGNDTISTGAGDDIIKYSGTSNGFDAVAGGAGYDKILATANGTYIGLSKVADIEEISAGGYTGVEIRGSSAADVFDFTNVKLTGISQISAGAGNDTVRGSAGNDKIDGGAGADTLSGGAGADVFDYDNVSHSSVTARDTILDFTQGQDKIDVSSIDASTLLSGNNTFKFIGTSQFSGTAGQLRVDNSDLTKTVVYGDVNGDGVADFAINLAGRFTLSSSDFIL